MERKSIADQLSFWQRYCYGERIMLDEATLEQRLATLEHTVADLQRQIVGTSTSSNWLEKVTGSISDQQAFLEALEYGKSLRAADRPTDEASEQS